MPIRKIFLGLSFGALTASVMAFGGPAVIGPAIAQEQPAKSVAQGFDTDNLVKFDDRLYRVDNEDWVATDPLSTVRVKKIEAGKVSYVTITTTASGTYSTDGMFSRHVQYPGISVEQVWPRNRFAYWSHGHWSGFAARIGDSFRYYGDNTGFSSFVIIN